MSKKHTKKSLAQKIGKCWMDFDHRGGKIKVGIECENPPYDKHYLLHFVPNPGDSSELMELANRISIF